MSTAAIDITDLIDRERVGRFQIMVVALCAAVVFMDGFDAQAIGYVAPTISKAWKLAPGALGPVFGAGLFGLMLGALIFGPIADRVGRRPVIILCTLAFGICTLLTVTADSLTSLLIWRLVTGFGLGGAMPNAIALTSEYSPQRTRATLIMIMFCGFSLGSALGGIIAAQLIPSWGWTGVFWLGGMLPVVLAAGLLATLPESIRLLALKKGKQATIAALLRRIAPQVPADAQFVVQEVQADGFAVRHLFEDGRTPVTVLLWVMFFMNLLDLYLLANWLPTIINGTGIPVTQAVYVAALFQVGGIIGTLTLGNAIDRYSPYGVLAGAYFAAGIFIIGTGIGAASVGAIIVCVFAAGFCIVGAQIGANALTAIFYPTAVRSTGVGWALGIGRIGSIVGPTVGGYMLSMQWPISTIFMLAAIPAVIASAAALAIGLGGRAIGIAGHAASLSPRR